MSDRRQSILFVHNWPMSFVQHDLRILREYYLVTERFEKKPTLAAFFNTPVDVYRHTLVFAWFASWHAFLPLFWARILGRPSILIIGGYDVANMPEIAYGHQRGGWRKWLSRLVMRLATRLVSFSEYSREEACLNAAIRREAVEVLYLGVPDRYSSLDVPPKNRRLVVTVGAVKHENLQRKGHLDFVQAARQMPELQFALIGGIQDDAIDTLRDQSPPNVTITGRVSDEELDQYFLQAAFYVQASRHEGFGLSVAEAMLAKCIPIVSAIGSLPEVVGEQGIYLRESGPNGVVEGLKRAAQVPVQVGVDARERILALFAVEKRAAGLCRLVDELIS